jgi:hypothetical protein
MSVGGPKLLGDGEAWGEGSTVCQFEHRRPGGGRCGEEGWIFTALVGRVGDPGLVVAVETLGGVAPGVPGWWLRPGAL